MKKWTCVLMAVAVLISASACVAAEKEKTEITIGVHFGSSGGISSSQLFDMANSLLKVVAEDYGYSLKMKKYSSVQDVMRAFLGNEIDAGVLFPSEMVEILDGRGEIYPLGTFAIDKKRKTAVCLWERKDNVLKNISGVAGKRILINNNPLAFVLLRELLFENGMDRPLWKVFNSFILPAGGNSAFLALAMGDADFYWDPEDSKEMLKLINPGLVPKVSYNFCTDRVYARGGIV